MSFSVKGIYASGMVLQQNAKCHISGTGEPYQKVILEFRGKIYQTKVSKKGDWKIDFYSFEAGGPFTLKINHQNQEIKYDDVFSGEVWLLSGQSNAQLPMERMRYTYKNDFALPKNNNIRMITIPISYCFGNQKECVEKPLWQAASPETLGAMSGTGYFFAKHLSSELGVPVGIINASQGGSPIASWMSEKSLKKMKKTYLLEQAEKWKDANNIEEKQKDVAQKQAAWDSLIKNADVGLRESWQNIEAENLDASWSDCNIPGFFSQIENAGVMWFKKEFCLTKQQAQNLNAKKRFVWMGTIVDADKVWINGHFVGETTYCYPPRRYEIPDGILKEGKNTITVRVQKNGKNPIVFYEEKKYCIFSEDVVVVPVAIRNTEKRDDAFYSDENYIELSGSWKAKIGCEVECAPGGIFFEWQPTALYNSMISPCLDYTISGALWYQGESNAGGYVEYESLLKQMIHSWRHDFKYAKKCFPFVIVQLPNWSDGKVPKVKDAGSWPQMREIQAKVASDVKNTSLAVLIDGGEWNDLHPEKKETCGVRAANQALKIAYGKNISKAPEVVSVSESENEWLISFDTDGSKLCAYKMNGQVANFSAQSDEVYGFSLVSKKHSATLVDVKAKLVSESEVIISKKELAEYGNVNDFCEIRYLWEDNPFYVNLYNSENVPAVPFRVKL